MLRELALFAGAGGGLWASKLLGWRTIVAVEKDEFCQRVLIARQDEGHFDPFPIWDDVSTFDGLPWAGCVDVVSGGFPCTDITTSGKSAGIEGEESGLWREMARIVCEVGPRFVFVENVAAITARGLGGVLGDLAAMGFDAEWGVLGANAALVRAPHKRERIWIVADSMLDGVEARLPTQRERHEGRAGKPDNKSDRQSGWEGVGWWAVEPRVGRLAHGVADRGRKLRALGNGQVPAVAVLAWRTLFERLEERREP